MKRRINVQRDLERHADYAVLVAIATITGALDGGDDERAGATIAETIAYVTANYHVPFGRELLRDALDWLESGEYLVHDRYGFSLTPKGRRRVIRERGN